MFRNRRREAMTRRAVRGRQTERGAARHSIVQASASPRLSIVLPIFEEEAEIGALITGIIDTLSSEAESFEVIAVDDGSKDRTADVLRELAERHPGRLRVARHLRNMGNGGGPRTGIRIAPG